MLLLLVSAKDASAPMLDRMLDSGLVTLVGMGIVYLSLLIIGEIMGIVGKLMSREPAPDPAIVPVPAPVVAVAPTPAHAGIDPRTLAILTAAAVAAVGGRPIHVRRITFLNQNTISAWADMGKVAIHTSHNLRRNM